MTDEDRVRLADAWLKYQDQEKDEDEWAIADLQGLVIEDPDEAWNIVQILVARGIDDEQLEMIGVATLEDLLVEYGDLYLAKLEAVDSFRPRYAKVLSHVRGMAPEIDQRVSVLIWRLTDEDECGT